MNFCIVFLKIYFVGNGLLIGNEFDVELFSCHLRNFSLQFIILLLNITMLPLM